MTHEYFISEQHIEIKQEKLSSSGEDDDEDQFSVGNENDDSHTTLTEENNNNIISISDSVLRNNSYSSPVENNKISFVTSNVGHPMLVHYFLDNFTVLNFLF